MSEIKINKCGNCKETNKNKREIWICRDCGKEVCSSCFREHKTKCEK